MIKTFDLFCTCKDDKPNMDLYSVSIDTGKYCYAEDLQKLWDFCDKEQQYLMSTIDTESLLKYNQGAIIAYRKIQYEINGRCSKFEDINEYCPTCKNYQTCNYEYKEDSGYCDGYKKDEEI